MANLANGEFQASKSSKLNRVAGAYRLNRVQACSYSRLTIVLIIDDNFKLLMYLREEIFVEEFLLRCL